MGKSSGGRRKEQFKGAGIEYISNMEGVASQKRKKREADSMSRLVGLVVDI